MITVIVVTILCSSYVLAIANNGDTYYTFDDSDLSGSNPLDESINNNHGTNSGASTGFVGAVGEAFSCDGGNDYIQTNQTTIDALYNPKSFSVWFNSSHNDGSAEVIMGVNSANSFWDILIDGASDYIAIYSGQYIGGTNGDIGIMDSGLWNEYNDSQWHHIVVVHKGNVVNTSNTNVWIDGINKTSGFINGWTSGSNPTNITFANEYRLCARAAGNAAFDGEVDEFGFWQRPLTQTEIVDLYNGSVNPYTIPLVTNSSLSPATASTSTDLLGYCNATDSDSTVLDYYYKWYRNEVENVTGDTITPTTGTFTFDCNLASSNTFNFSSLSTGSNGHLYSHATCIGAGDNFPITKKSDVVILPLGNTTEVMSTDCRYQDYSSGTVSSIKFWQDVMFVPEWRNRTVCIAYDDNSSFVKLIGNTLGDYDVNYTIYNSKKKHFQKLVSTLASGNTSKGDNWTISCLANDNSTNSSWLNSSYLTIGNTAPSYSDVTINPSSPGQNITLQGRCDFDDVDNDTLQFYYRWYKNGALNYSANTSRTYVQGTINNPHNISYDQVELGDNWTFSCLAYDGEENTSWFNSSTAYVDNTAPSVSNLQFIEDNVYVADTIYINYTFSDIDGDSDMSYYYFYQDGVLVKSGRVDPYFNNTFEDNSFQNWTNKTYEHGTYSYTGSTTVSGGSVTLQGPSSIEKELTLGDNLTFYYDSYLCYDLEVYIDGSLFDTLPKTGETNSLYSVNTSAYFSQTKNVIINFTGCDVLRDVDEYIKIHEIAISETEDILYLNSSFNAGENITIKITPNDGSLSGTSINTSLLINSSPPTISSRGFSEVEETLLINEQYVFQIDLSHSIEQKINYTVNHTLNNTEFNISFNPETVFVNGVIDNSTNMTITANSVLDPNEQRTGKITFTNLINNLVYNISVNFTTSNDTVKLSFADTTGWTFSGSKANELKRVFSITNNGNRAAGSCLFKTSGSLNSYLSYSSFTIGVNQSQNVEITLSGYSAGTYAENLMVECNNVTSYNSVPIALSISESMAAAGGGGNQEFVKRDCNWDYTETVELNKNEPVSRILIKNKEYESILPTLSYSEDVDKYIEIGGIEGQISPNTESEIVIRQKTNLNKTKTLFIKLGSYQCNEEDIKIVINPASDTLGKVKSYLFQPIAQSNLPYNLNIPISRSFIGGSSAIIIGLLSLFFPIAIEGKVLLATFGGSVMLFLSDKIIKLVGLI